MIDTYVQFEEKLILNKIKESVIYSEALKVISGVLKVMTLKTHGYFKKPLYLYFKVIWLVI